ncbi:MAG TPA: hypothetical protein VMR28_01215 [Candidatus Saccharimonadales bacterium]|nr:hypothetical protein [Candidatus Saccharimonadales bacterium]
MVYPTKEQGFRSFWNNVENDGFRTIEHVPKELIQTLYSTSDNMSMLLRNGSTLTLVGSNNNPESLRGANTKLYILSEFVDMRVGVLGVIRPITAVNDGQIIIESTVKQDGISGGTFLKLYSAAEKDPTQYAQTVNALEYMTQEKLDQVRDDYIIENGNDFLFRQEFLLDEGQALATSYYGNAVTRAREQKRIGNFPYKPSLPVYTSWDLGSGAGTISMLFWQYEKKKLNIIDAFETHDNGDTAIIEWLKSKSYNYGWHFFPHDGAKRDDADAIARIQKWRNAGVLNISLLRKEGKEDGIRRAIALLCEPTTTIHKPTTTEFVRKLSIYKRKFNQFTGDYEGPEHKSESHWADAFRYCNAAIEQGFRKDGTPYMTIPTKKKEPEMVVQETWESPSWDF